MHPASVVTPLLYSGAALKAASTAGHRWLHAPQAGPATPDPACCPPEDCSQLIASSQMPGNLHHLPRLGLPQQCKRAPQRMRPARCVRRSTARFAHSPARASTAGIAPPPWPPSSPPATTQLIMPQLRHSLQQNGVSRADRARGETACTTRALARVPNPLPHPPDARRVVRPQLPQMPRP